MKKFLLFILVIPTLCFAQFPETFDTQIPSSWAVFNGANGLGTVQQWKMQANGGSVVSAWEAVTPGMTAEDFLVTPQVTITAANPNLVFDLIQYNAPDYGSVFEVRISTTTQTSPAAFTTTVLSYTEANIPLSWQTIVVDLTSYIGQSIYIAFVHIQNDGDAIGLDNVDFASDCLPPSGFTLGNYTSTTAELSWAETGNYQLEYGEYPYTQGSGGSTATVTNGNSYLFNNLNPGVAYNVFVRKDCGGGEYSAWSENVIGTIPEVVSTFPYSNNLEIATNQYYLFNLGLSFVNTSGNWGLYIDDLTDGDTTNDYAQSPVAFLGSGFFTNADYDAWAFMPAMMLTAGNTYTFSFAHRVFSNAITTTPMDMEVVVSTTNDGAGAVILDSFTDVSSISYTTHSVTFTPTTTGTYYFGFHNNTPMYASATTGNFNLIDDIAVSETLGIEEISQNGIVSVLYPNPVKTEFNLKLADNFDANKTVVTLTDMNGRQVFSSNYSESINIFHLAKGVYIATISDGVNTENQKLIKE